MGRVAFAACVKASRKQPAVRGPGLRAQVWAGDLARSWQPQPREWLGAGPGERESLGCREKG